MFGTVGVSQQGSGMRWEKPALPTANLLFVVLIKVCTGNLGNELRKKNLKQSHFFTCAMETL